MALPRPSQEQKALWIWTPAWGRHPQERGTVECAEPERLGKERVGDKHPQGVGLLQPGTLCPSENQDSDER